MSPSTSPSPVDLARAAFNLDVETLIAQPEGTVRFINGSLWGEHGYGGDIRFKDVRPGTIAVSFFEYPYEKQSPVDADEDQ